MLPVHPLHRGFFSGSCPPLPGDRSWCDTVHQAVSLRRVLGSCTVQQVRQTPPVQKRLFSLCKGSSTQSQHDVPAGTGQPGLVPLSLPHPPGTAL